MWGLSPETIALIQGCIRQFPDVRLVKIYGSRARGDYRRGSDIDLAFWGAVAISGRLKAALDQLPTPYSFDLLHYESLTNPGLKTRITEEGAIFYKKENSNDMESE